MLKIMETTLCVPVTGTAQVIKEDKCKQQIMRF